MFKIVTNVEHWHNLYESKNCTEAFKRSWSIDHGAAAQHFSSILARASRKTSQREDVIALVSDDRKELWSLEAIVRAKFKGNFGDVLSENSEVRQEAIGQLTYIVTDLDRSVEEVEKKPKKKTLRTMPVAVAGVGAVAVLNFVLWMGTSSKHDDVIVAMDGVKGNTIVVTEQKIKILAAEFDKKVKKHAQDVEDIRVELVGDVKKVKDQIGELEGEIPKMERKYREFDVFKDKVLTDTKKIKNRLTGLEEADKDTNKDLSKLRVELEEMKIPTSNLVGDDNKFQNLEDAEDSIPVEGEGVEDRKRVKKVEFVQRYLAFGGLLGKDEVDGKLGENTLGAYNRWRDGICHGEASELEIDTISVDEAISMILYVQIGAERSALTIYCW